MRRSAIHALLIAAGVCFHAVCPKAGAQPEGRPASSNRPKATAREWPKAIVTRRDATGLETLAASEVRRYVYLRTGKLLPVKQGMTRGNRGEDDEAGVDRVCHGGRPHEPHLRRKSNQGHEGLYRGGQVRDPAELLDDLHDDDDRNHQLEERRAGAG